MTAFVVWAISAIVFFSVLYVVVKAAVRSALRESLRRDLLRAPVAGRVEDGRDRPLKL